MGGDKPNRTIFRIRDACLFRLVGDCRIQVLNLESRTRHFIEHLGAFVFLQFDGTSSLAEIGAKISGHFNDQDFDISQLKIFAQELKDLGLIESVSQRAQKGNSTNWIRLSQITKDPATLHILNQVAPSAATGCCDTGDGPT